MNNTQLTKECRSVLISQTTYVAWIQSCKTRFSREKKIEKSTFSFSTIFYIRSSQSQTTGKGKLNGEPKIIWTSSSGTILQTTKIWLLLFIKSDKEKCTFSCFLILQKKLIWLQRKLYNPGGVVGQKESAQPQIFPFISPTQASLLFTAKQTNCSFKLPHFQIQAFP